MVRKKAKASRKVVSKKRSSNHKTSKRTRKIAKSKKSRYFSIGDTVRARVITYDGEGLLSIPRSDPLYPKFTVNWDEIISKVRPSLWKRLKSIFRR